MKDTAIKLFGKKIALPENGWNPAVSGQDSSGLSGAEDGKSCGDLSSAKSACLGDKKVVMSRTGNEEEQSDHEEGKELAADDKVCFHACIHLYKYIYPLLIETIVCEF